ncbi:hypothetical protein HDU93_001463 [Gonapodya sp. JEL0774]|nr:hypothetical protein HDU93_001463 [Gonapodya sp. JEL0774]
MESFDSMLKLAGIKTEVKPKKKKVLESTGSVDKSGLSNERGVKGAQKLAGGMVSVTSPKRKSVVKKAQPPSSAPSPPPPPTQADIIHAENIRTLSRMAYQQSVSPSRVKSTVGAVSGGIGEPRASGSRASMKETKSPSPDARNAAHRASHKRTQSRHSQEADGRHISDKNHEDWHTDTPDAPAMVLPQRAEWTYDHEGRILPLKKIARSSILPAHPTVRILDDEPIEPPRGNKPTTSRSSRSPARTPPAAAARSNGTKMKEQNVAPSREDKMKIKAQSSVSSNSAATTSGEKGSKDESPKRKPFKRQNTPWDLGLGSDAARARVREVLAAANASASESVHDGVEIVGSAPGSDRKSVVLVDIDGRKSPSSSPLRPPTSPAAAALLHSILANPTAIVSLEPFPSRGGSPANLVSTSPFSSTSGPGGLPPIPSAPSRQSTPAESRSATPGEFRDGVRFPEVREGQNVVTGA